MQTAKAKLEVEMLGSSVTEVRRCGTPRAVLWLDPDREMRCNGCGMRVFTSLAPDLVDAAVECVRCGSRMTLIPSDAGVRRSRAA